MSQFGRWVRLPLPPPEIIPSIDRMTTIGGWFLFALKPRRMRVSEVCDRLKETIRDHGSFYFCAIIGAYCRKPQAYNGMLITHTKINMEVKVGSSRLLFVPK